MNGENLKLYVLLVSKVIFLLDYSNDHLPCQDKVFELRIDGK